MNLMRHLVVGAWILALASFSLAGPAGAASGASTFSHDAFDKILKRYVSEDGWVDYEGLKRGGAADLRAYLASLEDVDVSALGTKEQIAFWINAYNAVCIQLLLDKKLPGEVPRRSFLGVGTNLFKIEKYRVAGKVRSLDNIEHGNLRKRFTDNRIHAAVVCGASSCPRLRPEAFTGERLDTQLDEECRRWINVGLTKKGKRKNELDRGRKVFRASKIFSWYKDDFGGSNKGVLNFIGRYADPETKAFLEREKVSVTFVDYDWSLNKR